MRKGLHQKRNDRRGFTMMEVLAVVAVIVVLCAIAIPSVINIRASLEQKQRDDYAKTIFLAAQNHLVELRSEDKLKDLPTFSQANFDLPAGETTEYVYVSSDDTANYALILPVNSVESTLRDQQVIIEFRPKTGAVYSVFYHDGENELSDLYSSNVADIRNEGTRKDYEVGYYEGSELETEELKIVNISANLLFDKGEEGLLTIEVPVHTENAVYTPIFQNDPSGEHFMKGMYIQLTLTGENGGVLERSFNYEGSKAVDSGYTMGLDVTAKNIHVVVSLDSLLENKGFADLVTVTDEAGNTSLAIHPGDNISVVAEVTYTPQAGDPIVDIENTALAGINPMFDSLTKDGDKYVLAVSNGRHLQNLSKFDQNLAVNVKSVVFAADVLELDSAKDAGTDPEIIVDWNVTEEYYKKDASGNYLVKYEPIVNEALFGSAEFAGNTLKEKEGVASVLGNGCKIYNLSINDNVNSSVGLFGSANTSIDDLELVNPRIEGGTQATGALIGAMGSKSLLTDCGVYLDTSVEGFDLGNYYVKGNGAVGGLVGYACSEKDVGTTVDLSLTPTALREKNVELLDYVSFYRCFAAVPVEGTMGSENGYINGVGGLVGNSQRANFYSCYASGDVTATGAVVTAKVSVNLGISANGETSQGVGGFVGTSHGSCYSNCFSTGNVNGDTEAAGGFVGVMCYDSTSGPQHTVFTSCYSVGGVTVGGTAHENFSGVNASLDVNISGLSDADFYKLYAPYYVEHSGNSELTYQSDYIFKDSYYLNQMMNVEEEYCASAERYSIFKTLHEHKTSDWADTQVLTLKNTTLIELKPSLTIVSDALNFLRSVIDVDSLSWRELASLTNLVRNHITNNTNLLFNIYFELEPSLDSKYLPLYRAGFSDEIWSECAEENTHVYEKLGYNPTYPFSMLKDMEYYGNWPTVTPAAGLAYYEAYHGKDEEGKETYSYGFYYDKEETATLKDNAVVASDGYAVFYNDIAEDVSVQVNGEECLLSWSPVPTQLGTAENPAGQYYYAFLPAEVMIRDHNESMDDFYSKVEVVSGDETYTLYFNPNVALSQVNPTDGTTTAKEPSKPPQDFYIRTARQLAALGNSMEAFWGEFRIYTQQTNIDFSQYDFHTYNTVDKTYDFGELNPIGNTLAPFLATYKTPMIRDEDGALVVSKKQIIGYPYSSATDAENSGIFGVIGEGAIVNGLEIVPVVEEPILDERGKPVTNKNGEVVTISELNVEKERAQNIGLLAGKNQGLISNSSVILTGDVALSTAAEGSSIGLLVGESSGTLNACSVSVPMNTEVNDDFEEITEGINAEVSITATNAGVMTGSMVGGWAKDCIVSSDEKSSLIFTVDGTSAGGFIGSTAGTRISNTNVAITSMYVNNVSSAGGLVGYTGLLDQNICSIFENCDVDVNLTAEAGEKLYAGGLLGRSEHAQVKNCTASGSITKDTDGSVQPAAENEVTVGGAVGYANGGVFTEIDTNVQMDEQWKGSLVVTLPVLKENETTTEEILPIGSPVGSIGLFAGHIEDGSFLDCTANDTTNTQYQFLGTVKASGKTILTASHYALEKFNEDELKKTILLSKLTPITDEMQPLEAYIIPTTLTNCTFTLNKAEYVQAVGGDVYYYLIGGEYKAQESAAIFNQGTPTDEELDAWLTKASGETDNWVATNYYVAHTSEDAATEYERVYVQITPSGDTTYHYQYALKAEEQTGENGTDETKTKYNTISGDTTLYSISGWSDGQYILSVDEPTGVITENDLWIISGNNATVNGITYTMELKLEDFYVEGDSVEVMLKDTSDDKKDQYHKFYSIFANFTYIGSNDNIRIYDADGNVIPFPITAGTADSQS